MKRLKRITAALLAAVCLFPMAACSTDKSWAAKDDSLTVPIGSYIYNLYTAYKTAANEVPDTSKDVLSQQIDGQDASTWIRNKAMNYTKQLFVVDNKMKELGLTLSDSEQQEADSMASSAWSSYQTTLEGYGIAQSSFQIAYSDYYYKMLKVFYATYGKGGAQEVSDSDLTSYYESTYTDFTYIACPLYTTDSSGNFQAMLSDDETSALKTELDGYAQMIQSGEMTIDDAAAAYTQSSGNQTTASNQTIVLSDSSLPDEAVSTINAMQNGSASAFEIDGYYVYLLVVKNDIHQSSANALSTEDSRNNVLLSYKGQEFNDEISSEADSVTGVTLNSAAINSYNPSMFTGSVSLSASTSSD